MGNKLSSGANREDVPPRDVQREIRKIYKEHKAMVVKSLDRGKKAYLEKNLLDANVHYKIALNSIETVENLKFEVLNANKNEKFDSIQSIKNNIMSILNHIQNDTYIEDDLDPCASLPRRELPPFDYSQYSTEDAAMLKPIMAQLTITNPQEVRWEDIIGCTTAKNTFKNISDSFFDETIAPLYDKGIFKRRQGIAVFGPPGVGNVYFAFFGKILLVLILIIFKVL